MTASEFVQTLQICRLVASVQAADGSPVQIPDTLARLALASAREGVRMLRLQGVDAIREVRSATGLPTIGLIKRDYPDSEIYITPTQLEVREIVDAGAEIVALDATARARPKGERLADLIELAHGLGMLVLADIDSPDSATYAARCGADILSTTLAGYTAERKPSNGPDLDVLREVVADSDLPVLAEGRYVERWQVEAALRIGAAGVVVGGAINDPGKNTRRIMPRQVPIGKIAAVDIGGTWIRFGLFSESWQLLGSERAPNPRDRGDRLDWIRRRLAESGASRVGIGTGGIVDPATGEVWTAKEYLMPDHIGIRFDEASLGVPAFAHGDGHATAWGHSCLPRFAGKRVATLAIGTGVGCGFVQDGRIWCGHRGEYPRINDLPAADGRSYEDLLGGFHIGRAPSADAQGNARVALCGAVSAIRGLYFPDEIVLAGSVGLSPWLSAAADELGLVSSPFGIDAGLFGAAALAIYPV